MNHHVINAAVAPLFATHLRKLHHTLHASLPCKYEETIRDIPLDELAKSAITERQSQREQRRTTFILRNALMRNDCRTDELYTSRLLRQIVLTQFELLCTSLELLEDVEYAFGACKAICVAADQFNSDVAKAFGGRVARLTVADFATVVVETHSRRISRQLCSSSLRADVALREARFELGFVRAFLGILATYTSFFPRAPSTSYVSDEMFLIAKEQTPTWYDCLIPGAQCEALRVAAHDVVNALWGRVSSCLVTKLQHRRDLTDLAEKLRVIMKTEGLSYHVAVVESLWHAAAMLEQRAALVDWDIGMLQMLAASYPTNSSIYKSNGIITQPSKLFLSHVVPPLLAYLSSLAAPKGPSPSLAAPPSLAHHLNTLSLSRPLGLALLVSVRVESIFLSMGLQQGLAALNLRTLGQILFVDGPTVVGELREAVRRGVTVCAPRVLLPDCCPLKGNVFLSRDVCAELYLSRTQLEERLEDVRTSFYYQWRAKCSQVIRSNFPDRKWWRTIGKEDRVVDLVPSPYTNEIVFGLIFPCMDAASHLPQQPQLLFLSLALSTVIVELRITITSNKKLYRPFAGRQLLADCRHISKCLQSKEVQLDPEVSNILPLLPGLREMEHGLLVICGTASSGEEEDASPGQEGQYQLHPDLARELAWYSQRDWTACMD